MSVDRRRTVRLQTEVAAVARQFFRQAIDCVLYGLASPVTRRTELRARAAFGDPIAGSGERLQELLFILVAEVRSLDPT